MAAKVGASAEVVTYAKLGRKPTLPQELEKQLLQYVLTMEAKLFGLVRKGVMSLAYQLTTKNNITHTFSAKIESAGKDWLRSFLERHQELFFVVQQEFLLIELKDLIKKVKAISLISMRN